MPKLHDEWMVLPHGPLREIEPGLLTVVGHPMGPGAWVMSRLMGFGPTPRIPRVARRMFIKIRLPWPCNCAIGPRCRDCSG